LLWRAPQQSAYNTNQANQEELAPSLFGSA